MTEPTEYVPPPDETQSNVLGSASQTPEDADESQAQAIATVLSRIELVVISAERTLDVIVKNPALFKMACSCVCTAGILIGKVFRTFKKHAAQSSECPPAVETVNAIMTKLRARIEEEMTDDNRAILGSIEELLNKVLIPTETDSARQTLARLGALLMAVVEHSHASSGRQTLFCIKTLLNLLLRPDTNGACVLFNGLMGAADRAEFERLAGKVDQTATDVQTLNRDLNRDFNELRLDLNRDLNRDFNELRLDLNRELNRDFNELNRNFNELNRSFNEFRLNLNNELNHNFNELNRNFNEFRLTFNELSRMIRRNVQQPRTYDSGDSDQDDSTPAGAPGAWA